MSVSFHSKDLTLILNNSGKETAES